MPNMHDRSVAPPEALKPPAAAATARPDAVHLSLTEAPERERPGILRDFFGRTLFRLDVEPLRDSELVVDVTVRKLPGLQVFTGRRHGSRNSRSREMLSDGADDFSLIVNLGGPYAISQGREEIELDDGEATIVTSAEPTSYMHRPPGKVLALRFPRAPFAPLVTNIDDCYVRRIPAGTPALRLLKDYVGSVRDDGLMASLDLQRLMVTHVYDLMAVALGVTRDAAEIVHGRGVRAARLNAIKRDIAQNIDRADLSVAAVAARHRVTPRFVQRLFEAEGTTFTDFVLVQRLARAHRLLGDPLRGNDKISAIAFDSGFGDVSYFNRAFRRQYGAAPSDVRAQMRRPADLSDPASA
ncbi:MAG: helix-turn-helix domain-containing protein [Alphaproteobacteria bacterium]|nr:helix-turn-helix domain-containing protein [Alphaproteobacteria bacterium]